MCDTFIALPNCTADGAAIFAKNSDREANESQIIEYHPEKNYPQKTVLKCTHIEVPQASQTHAVIISRPFWMWGAEMGVNNKGVVIGNEAVFTKIKVAKQNVLTGMDLLRLALERADTAQLAKQTIIDLLQEYGQGGRCGYADKNFSYHNSFIIADKKEAWVLETAGKFWATKKVSDYYAISNGLTIGTDYDAIHPQAIAFAKKKGWVKNEFNFATAFSDYLYTTFSGSKKRQCRAAGMLKKNYFKINVSTAMSHLRDHNTLDFEPSKSLISNTICAHAANGLTRHAAQTTGSMVVHLTKDKPTVWVTASSAPCVSIFKPLWFDGRVLPDLGSKPEAIFNDESFWWRHEILHRTVLKDFKNRHNIVVFKRDKIEKELLKNVYHDKKKQFLTSKMAFEKNWAFLEEWFPKIKNSPIKKRPNFWYRNYWRRLNKVGQIF
ncbi:MAG: C69 family dipeptidase [Flavobacteriaceae bacterium]